MEKKLQFKKKTIIKRLFLLFFMIFGMTTQNTSYGVVNSITNVMQQIKEKKVSINMTNSTLKEILYEIHKQSKISFIYSNDKELEILKVTLNVTNLTVEQTLNQLLKGTGFTYNIEENGITIYKQKSKVNTQNSKVSVKGRVIDDNGEAITGATVMVTGTNNGAITDDKGQFSLQLNTGQEFEVTFIGFKNEKYTATKAEDNLIIKLKKDALAIDDVMITGIFERRSGTFSGSATTFKADDLKRVGNQNVFASLKNLDPSLMIFDNLEFGSNPNKTPKMTLRGNSSFDLQENAIDIKGTYGNDPNAPLFILDGFEASVQKIMDLDMNRIETLVILKDASAKAIYGSKAANGVIVIETKKNGGDELRLSYTGSIDIQAPDLSSYNMTNSAQKVELEKLGRLFEDNDYNVYLEKQAIYNQKLAAVISGVNTDWLSKPLRTGIGTKHFLSLETGTNAFRAIADFSYNNVNGVMKGSKRTTYSGDINLSYRHKKFNFRNILSVVSNIAEDSSYGQFYEYVNLNPYYSPYDKSGRLLKDLSTSIFDEAENKMDFIENPLYNAGLNTIKEQRYIDLTNTLYVEWFVLDGLKATARLGVTEKRNSADEFYPSNHLKFYNYSDEDYFRRGSYAENTGKNKSLSGDLNVQYSKTFKEKHYLFSNIGANLSEDSYQETIHRAEGFPNDKMNNIIFAKQYAKDSKPTGIESTIRNVGVLGVFNYSYDNRYLIDASYRINASSQYGANNRWGQFWSTGIGWNIHNERFLKDVKAITNFKLRGSVGYTGSQSSGAYDAMATYIYNLDRTYRGQLGSYLKGMRNENLKWQHKMDYNAGFDLNISRRFMFTFDYYVGITQNTLIDMTIPPSMGFSTVKENVGTIENKGFDIRATYIAWQKVKDNSSLSFMLNISRNKNKITGISDSMKEYNQKQDEIANDILNNKPVNKYYDGVSMNAIWAVPSLGIDPVNGRELYLNREGVPTYSYNAANQIVVGDNLPKVHGTAGVFFQYKGVGLNLSFIYQYGAKMYNQTLVNKVENADINNNVDARMFDGVWKTAGDVKPYKAVGNIWVEELKAFKMLGTQPTSRFVQNRNEFSLSSLSLSYDFGNHNFIKSSKMKALKFSFYMNDVFVLSSIKVERGTSYPFARSFNFAINATF